MNFNNDITMEDFIDVKEAYEQGRIDATRWIPCSERLPELKGDDFKQSDNMLLTCEWINGDMYQDIGWYIQNNIYHMWNVESENCKVIAWMPLPQPYREEQNQ